MTGAGGTPGGERFEEFVDAVDGSHWRVDMDFMASNWTCLWGSGCEGILEQPAAELGQGCCSVGAELIDEDEARRIAALGLTLDPTRFQYAEAALSGGVFAEDDRLATRVVDGACIFLNRPGFEGGEGCALHIAAIDDGEQPMDWKPSICWQLPLKVDRSADGGTDGLLVEASVKNLRRWRRSDWGNDGETMAWCCTERRPDGESGTSAYVGLRPVAEALFDEIAGLVGQEVAVEIRSRATL